MKERESVEGGERESGKARARERERAGGVVVPRADVSVCVLRGDEERERERVGETREEREGERRLCDAIGREVDREREREGHDVADAHNERERERESDGAGGDKEKRERDRARVELARVRAASSQDVSHHFGAKPETSFGAKRSIWRQNSTLEVSAIRNGDLRLWDRIRCAFPHTPIYFVVTNVEVSVIFFVVFFFFN